MESEREPLLGTPPEQTTLTIPNLAHSLAALRAGKLPSTLQLSTLLRAFLRSPLLQIEGTIFSTTYGSGRIGTGALTKEGESVRAALRELVEALLRAAMERNAEDQLQEFMYACRKAELELSEFRLGFLGEKVLTTPVSQRCLRPRSSLTTRDRRRKLRCRTSLYSLPPHPSCVPCWSTRFSSFETSSMRPSKGRETRTSLRMLWRTVWSTRWPERRSRIVRLGILRRRSWPAGQRTTFAMSSSTASNPYVPPFAPGCCSQLIP